MNEGEFREEIGRISFKWEERFSFGLTKMARKEAKVGRAKLENETRK